MDLVVFTRWTDALNFFEDDVTIHIDTQLMAGRCPGHLSGVYVVSGPFLFAYAIFLQTATENQYVGNFPRAPKYVETVASFYYYTQ